MSVSLRLRRMGRKQHPIFGLVAADSRAPRDGRFIEDLGRYEPVSEPAIVKIDAARVIYWLSQGAQPSHTVHNLLQREGYESLNEVREEGLGQGLEQGLARGKRDVLFKLIARAGSELTAVQRQVVEECRDPATLDLWIDRALSGQTVEEILG